MDDVKIARITGVCGLACVALKTTRSSPPRQRHWPAHVV
jgi:hypothetical protein